MGAKLLRRRVVGLMAVGCFTVSLALVASADAKKYDFTYTPKIGGARTTFVVSFVAPFAERRMSFYSLEVFGPPGCAASSEVTLTDARAGERVRLRLGPDDVEVPSPRRRWCPGRYIGNVQYYRPSGQRNLFIGYVSFRVRR
jgi:hypothetical protein